MKHPAVMVALVYGGGLLLGEYFQPEVWVLFTVALGFATAAIAWSKARRWLVWSLLLFTGWTNLVFRTAILSPHDLRITQTESAEIIVVRGTLIETPSQRIYLREDREVSRSLAVLQTSEVRRGTNWTHSYGQILLLTPGRLPEQFYGGQEVEVNGVISFPPRAEAEGLFDYRSYLKRQGVYYQVKVESTNDWTLIIPSRGRPVADRFLGWAQGVLAKGLGREDESLELLWAMTLGWKTALTNEIYEPFMRSGTMHIFAISGLHIALISGILVAVLRVLRIARAWCGLIVVPLIWFYTWVTGWQPSAIRSAIMMTIVIGGWSLKRPSDLLNSLAASAFFILLWDPQQLFGASFQLSFFCVLSIALILPPVRRSFDRLVATDPLLPAELVPAWRRKLDVPLRWLVSSLATSTAAWLGSLPLTAYYFHLFSPVTLLANLLIVPLSSMALSCNVGSLICGYWLPSVTDLFNHSAWFWMECMIRLSELASIVPGFYVYVRGPSGLELALYYAAIAGALSGWLIAPKRRIWTLVGGGIVAAFYFWGWEIENHSARVTILAENGGLTVFAETPGLANAFVIDPGTTNAVDRVLKPYLRARGLNRLATMVLTHGDVRHVSGATLLADLFSLRQIYTSPVRFRSPAYRRALNRFTRPNNRVKLVTPDDVVEGWTVLYPSESEQFPQADNNALVLSAKLYGTRLLLVSDLGIKGQNVILARGLDLKADIVVTGLPTDGEALSDAFLQAVRPRLIIVADCEYPASEQARPSLRSRLERRKVPVLYSRAEGTITMEFRRGTWRLQTRNGVWLDGSKMFETPKLKAQ